MEPTLKFAQIPGKGPTTWNPSFEFSFVIIDKERASCWYSRRNSAVIEPLGSKGQGSIPWGFTYKE